MSIITILSIIASVTFVSMMSPGPDMMLLVKYSGYRERLAGVGCVIGICLGLLFHSFLAIGGAAAIIMTSPTLYTILKIIGALYLIYLGVNSLLATKELRFDQGAEEHNFDIMIPLKEGLFCNLLNPKVTMFILALFTQVIDVDTTLRDKFLYTAFMLVVVFIVWNAFVAVLRVPLVLNRLQCYQRTINQIVGVLLIVFGGLLALS